MKRLSETAGLVGLAGVRDEFRSAVGVFEQKAKACSECSTPGACCLDEHFVNVRISQLEAVAIRKTIDQLTKEKRAGIDRKISATVRGYELNSETDKTYACPLYDRSAGCLVHESSEPLPCIHHACYERKEDLPPNELLDDAEMSVERLNRKVYGRSLPLLPLPVAIRNVSESA